jgi:uncharacterized membrane protein
MVAVLAAACTDTGSARRVGVFAGESEAVDVNGSGVVVGSADSADPIRGFAWRVVGDGPVEDLGPTDTRRSWTEGVNRNGDIVGAKSFRGTVWHADGRTLELPVPFMPFFPGATPERVQLVPYDINDNGIVVGGAIILGAGVPRPAVWDLNTGRSMLLETPDSCDSCEVPIPAPGVAEAVNNRGQIVGTALNADPSVAPTGWHAVVWNPIGEGRWGPVQWLPEPEGVASSQALDINDRGAIVGGAYRPVEGSPVGVSVPVLWSGSGHDLTVIPAPPASSGGATSINAGGVVVGSLTQPETTSSVAFRWRPGDPVATVLPGLGGGTEAAAISDTGVIVGTSRTVEEPYRRQAVRWDPTPRPSAPPRLLTG